jgi:hypothetical protein
MTGLDWDELDNQLELFKAKMPGEFEGKTLVIGNLNGFVAQLREWGYGRAAAPVEHPKDCNYPCCD